jgi:hypothetical protein
VIRAIKELELYGYLEVERSSGSVSKYYLKVLV